MHHSVEFANIEIFFVWHDAESYDEYEADMRDFEFIRIKRRGNSFLMKRGGNAPRVLVLPVFLRGGPEGSSGSSGTRP